MQSANAEFTGLSGRRYTFRRYDRIPLFKTRIPCVYCIARRATAGGDGLRLRYVGQTDDFNGCFSATRTSALRPEEGDVLLILPLNDVASRAGIHIDMLMGLYQKDRLSSGRGQAGRDAAI